MTILDTRGAISAFSFTLLVIGAQGCSTVSTQPIEPIETQTEQLFDQVQFELDFSDLILLNPYVERNSGSVGEFDEARLELRAAAELLVNYSVEIIDLARLDSDEEAIEALVPLLREFFSNLGQQSLVEPHLRGVDIEAITADVAGRPNLIKALQAASPAHEAAAVGVRSLIDITGERFDRAYEQTRQKITTEYSTFMAYTDVLLVERNEVLEQLLLLNAAKEGDSQAWETLVSNDQGLAGQLGAATRATNTGINEAEELLVARLARQTKIWGYLEPSWRNYQETLEELHRVESQARKVLQLSSYVIEGWDRAQRELAKGQPAGFVKVTKNLAYLLLRKAAQ